MNAERAIVVQRWETSSRVSSIVAALVLAILAFVPFALGPNVTNKLTQLFILVILAVMWNALAGFAGLVSVGQQAFIGIGAYAAVVLADDGGLNAYVAIVIAALIAGVLAMPISLLAFRLRGGQFAIGMWVIAETLRLLVGQIRSLGGGTGLSLRATNVYEPALRQAYAYWVALGLMVVLLVVVVMLLRSRVGLSLQAIRDSEVGASSLGVEVVPAKRLIFLLAAVGCGAAGGLIAANTLTVQPNSIFGVQYSAFMIFMVLLGGLGTIEGPIIGALIFFVIQQQFSQQGTWYLIGLGLLAIIVTLLAPRGLWGTIVDRTGLRLVPVGYKLRGLPAERGSEADPTVAAEGRDTTSPATTATRTTSDPKM